jgi:hypothetical protein
MAHAFKLILGGTSPSSASTVVGNTVGGLQKLASIRVDADLTGATGGTLDVYLQTSHDEGSTWRDYAHFAQVAAGAAVAHFSFMAFRATGSSTIVATGSGTSPALAANAVLGGDFGDRMRVVYVAGAGTSAGAAQTITVSGTIGYGAA